MQRKKILIIGTRPDEVNFLSELAPVDDAENVYQIGDAEVVIERSSAHSKMLAAFPQSLAGYHAVISVFAKINTRSELLSRLLLIDDQELAVFINMQGDGNATEYMKDVLEQIKDRNAYQPANVQATPYSFVNAFHLVGTLFASSKQQQHQQLAQTCHLNHIMG